MIGLTSGIEKKDVVEVGATKDDRNVVAIGSTGLISHCSVIIIIQ